MPISIRSPEVKRLAQLLSEREETNVTEAIKTALTNALADSDWEVEKRKARLIEIASSCAALSDYDSRTEDEILGYDSEGAFEHGHR